jgi:TRAP-type C4-dicarboxylate transport system substrate-binding protein
MSRTGKSVVFFLFITLALVSTGSLAADASAKVKLTYASPTPSSTFPAIQMERWKEEVQRRTNGVVSVNTFPGGSLLGFKEMMSGVVDGIADIGIVAFPYQPGLFPLLEGVDLPIGFSNAKTANAVLWDLNEKYRPASLKDVKVIALFTAPPANIMSKDPIRVVGDLKGYELRSTGAGVASLKLLGASPVAMPMPETPEALQKGVVKGVFSSLDVLKDFKFAETCRYVTICRMQTTSFGVIMNKAKWDALPENVKAAIDGMAHDHSLWVGDYIDQHGRDAVKWSKETYNVEVIELPKAEFKLWHDKMSPITDAWLKRTKDLGLPGAAFLEDLTLLKDKYEAEFGE